MKQKKMFILWVVLSCLAAVFIFSQSLPSIEESAAQSGKWMVLLRRLLDPSGRIDEHTFHTAIRKAAHLIEFAVLGLCVGASAVCGSRLRQRSYLALPVLVTVLVALADEYIQSFTGRGSQVSDVVLDFAGALIGFGLAALAAWIAARRKRGQHETGK